MDIMDLQEVMNEFLLTLDDFIPPHLQKKQHSPLSPSEHKLPEENCEAREQISRTHVSSITQEALGSPGQCRKRHWIRFDGIGPTDKDGMPFASRSSVDKPRDWYRSMFRVLHRLSDSDESDNESKEKETITLHKSGHTDHKQWNHDDRVGHATTSSPIKQSSNRTFNPNSRELERSQSFTLSDPKRTISPIPRTPERTLYSPTIESPISLTSTELQRTPSSKSREQQRAPRSLPIDPYSAQTFTSKKTQGTVNATPSETHRTLFFASSEPRKTHNSISSQGNRTLNHSASTQSSYCGAFSTPPSSNQSSCKQLPPGLSNQGTNSTFERKPFTVSSKASREPQRGLYSRPVHTCPGMVPELQEFYPTDIESLFSHCFSTKDKVHSSDSTQMEPTSSISPIAKKAGLSKSSTSKALEKLEAELQLFNEELNRDLVDHMHTTVYTSYVDMPMQKSPAMIGGSRRSESCRTVDTPSTLEEKLLARAVVKFDFSAESPKELSLQRGTTLLILKRVDKNWLLGQQDGRRGLFPESYVRVLSPGESEQPVVPHLSGVALYDFEAESDAELSLTKIAQWFTPPENATCVQVVAPCSTQELAGTKCRVLYSYTPNNEDELHLIPGDTVTVSQHCDDGWYVGVCWRTKRFGTFPGNFVVPV
ncbi:sorbin and SH3 domain-containing protein 2 isoform X2 [Xenopus laevis]|uniref:Sorbin and SH3 domain-containing protein 2 isoform X2 n=1 Tax=Xenopus laevis TaxID=8355 RepID=A0A8J0UZD7_XENLA|nr:sorbin and SH3 domain-containing protein 2 isoform X2 [Xenopus laevis]